MVKTITTTQYLTQLLTLRTATHVPPPQTPHARLTVCCLLGVWASAAHYGTSPTCLNPVPSHTRTHVCQESQAEAEAGAPAAAAGVNNSKTAAQPSSRIHPRTPSKQRLLPTPAPARCRRLDQASTPRLHCTAIGAAPLARPLPPLGRQPFSRERPAPPSQACSTALPPSHWQVLPQAPVRRRQPGPVGVRARKPLSRSYRRGAAPLTPRAPGEPHRRRRTALRPLPPGLPLHRSWRHRACPVGSCSAVRCGVPRRAKRHKMSGGGSGCSTWGGASGVIGRGLRHRHQDG